MSKNCPNSKRSKKLARILRLINIYGKTRRGRRVIVSSDFPIHGNRLIEQYWMERDIPHTNAREIDAGIKHFGFDKITAGTK